MSFRHVIPRLVPRPRDRGTSPKVLIALTTLRVTLGEVPRRLRWLGMTTQESKLIDMEARHGGMPDTTAPVPPNWPLKSPCFHRATFCVYTPP